MILSCHDSVISPSLHVAPSWWASRSLPQRCRNGGSSVMRHESLITLEQPLLFAGGEQAEFAEGRPAYAVGEEFLHKTTIVTRLGVTPLGGSIFKVHPMHKSMA